MKEKIKAKKSLGQNFLIDENTLEKISRNFDLEGKNILEVGPGYGALTEYLLKGKPKSLHLVELDIDMINILEKRLLKNDFDTGTTDFQFFCKDVLTFEPSFGDEDYYVIANIPYYITSPILRRFLYDIKHKPDKMLILMQKEVAERIVMGQGSEKDFRTQKKGKNKSSVLSLFIAKKARVEEIAFVPAEFFNPMPKIDSFVLAFELEEKAKDIRDEVFLEFIKKAFAEPRKKLSSNLKKAGYQESHIDDFFVKYSFDKNIRAEDLSFSSYTELISFLDKDK